MHKRNNIIQYTYIVIIEHLLEKKWYHVLYMMFVHVFEQRMMVCNELVHVHVAFIIIVTNSEK